MRDCQMKRNPIRNPNFRNNIGSAQLVLLSFDSPYISKVLYIPKPIPLMKAHQQNPVFKATEDIEP